MSDSNLELKQLALAVAEIKVDDRARSFAGYASVFGGVDAYGDSIVPGAYKSTLANRARPVRMRFNHTSPVIGKWTDLREDDRGLFVKGELTPGHSLAEDVYASLKHGAVDGLSIGYRVPPGGAEFKNGIRYLKRIDLVEISVVEEPADGAAVVADVKILADRTSPRVVEQALREQLGFSRRQAKRFMAEGFSGLAMSDAEEEMAEIAAALRQINSLLRS